MSVVIPSLRAAIAVPPWVKNELWRRARAVPSLDLRFVDNKSLIDAVSGASLITYTRASSGTYTDSAGVIQTAATDVPRFDHNPTTGESLGLLVEEQRTNSMLRSEEFDDAAWIPFSLPAAVTANNAIAPNGTLTADLITGVSAVADQSVQVVTVLNSTVYTYSIYIKQNTTLLTRIGLLNTTTSEWMGAVDIAWVAGVPSTSSTIGSPSSISYVAANNGWYRCSFALTTTATSAQVHFHPDRNNTQASAWTWGAQLEAGSFPTSYIPTTSATVTRAADVASITGANFSSWYNQTEGTMFAEALAQEYTIDNDFPRVFSLDDGGATFTFIALVRALGSRRWDYSAFIASAGQAVGLNNNISPSVGAVCKGAVIYRANDFTGATQGVLMNTDTSGSVPTVNAFGIGMRSNGTLHFNGHIRRITYWPTRLANSTLQSITS